VRRPGNVALMPTIADAETPCHTPQVTEGRRMTSAVCLQSAQASVGPSTSLVSAAPNSEGGRAGWGWLSTWPGGRLRVVWPGHGICVLMWSSATGAAAGRLLPTGGLSWPRGGL